MKKLLPLFIFILFTNILYSQDEYKISTEGFTFGKPVGDNVKLTVYLSATNIGSVEEFSGQLRNIKLTSGKYSTTSYYPEDYKRIIEIIKPTHNRTKTNFNVESGNPNGSAIISTSSRRTNEAAA